MPAIRMPIGIALALAIALSCSPPAFAQAKKPSEKAASAKSFDPHDLSGVWQQDHPRLITVDARLLGL